MSMNKYDPKFCYCLLHPCSCGSQQGWVKVTFPEFCRVFIFVVTIVVVTCSTHVKSSQLIMSFFFFGFACFIFLSTNVLTSCFYLFFTVFIIVESRLLSSALSHYPYFVSSWLSIPLHVHILKASHLVSLLFPGVHVYSLHNTILHTHAHTRFCQYFPQLFIHQSMELTSISKRYH